MKKFIFGLIATVMFGFVGNAQNVISGKISNGKDVIDLPQEVVSSLKYDIKSDEFSTISKYSKTYQGIVYLVVDTKNLIVGVVLPPTVSKAAMGPILNCFKDCNRGGGSESGAWLCYYLCLTGL